MTTGARCEGRTYGGRVPAGFDADLEAVGEALHEHVMLSRRQQQ